MSNNPIKSSDLYQDDGSIQEAIKQMEALREVYVKNLDAITKEAEKLMNKLNEVNTTTKEGQETTRRAATDAEKLKNAQREYATALNETNTKIRALKDAKRQDIKVQKLQEKAAKSAKGSYNQLSAQYALNKLRLNAMSKAERDATKSGKALEKQTREIYEEMNRLQKATGKHQLQVGKYPKIIPGVTKLFAGLVGTFGLIEGARLFKGALKDIAELKREAKGIEFAFRQIENGEDILKRTRAATRGVLSDLDIKKSANEFKNFNLDVEKLPELLEFVAVRAAQTGKSFEGLRDSLVEGLSKESKLRIDNLGISTQELNAELKKTPNFIQAVANIAQREVAKAGGVLDEAANAQAKWNADLKNFMLIAGDGIISRASNALYSFGSNILRAITPTRDLVKEIKQEQIGLNALVNQITDVNIGNEDRLKLIDKLKTDYPFFLKLIKQEKTDNESLVSAMQEVNEMYIKRIALQTQQTRIEELLNKSGDRAYDNALRKVRIDQELARINREVLGGAVDLTNKSFEERVRLIKEELAAKAVNEAQGSRRTLNKEATELAKLNAKYTQYNGGLGNAANLAKETAKEQELMRQIEEEMGVTLEQLNKMFGVNIKVKKASKDATVELTDAQKKSLALEKERLQLALMPAGREKDLQALENEYKAKKVLAQKHGIDIALVTEWERTQRAAINKKWDDKEIADEKAKQDKIAAAKRKKFSGGTSVIDQQFDLAMSEIDLLKKTENEKTRLRLEAEKKRLQAILDLNKRIGGQLTNLQIKQMQNVIKKLDQEIQNVGSGDQKDIYDLVGLKLDGDQKAAISESVSFALDNVRNMLAARVEAADIMLQKAQEETDAAQSRYDQEIEARNNGYANNVLNAQRELELKKRQEAQALKEKQKAQKAQEAIDTAMQVSGLITSSVQIWKALAGIPVIGPGLAAAAVGVMWASYAASKIKAKSVAKEKFGEGGLEFLSGGSHASGNDIPIGTTKSGKQRTAEGGEAMAIIKKSSTRKYKGILPNLINSLNKGTFEHTYSNAFIPAEQMPPIINAGYDSVDLKQTEEHLAAIRANGEVQRYTDADGNLVEVYKNVKRVYV